MLHTKYQGSMSCGFREDFFMVFLYKSHVYAYVKSVIPGAWPFLTPGTQFEQA